MWPPPHAFARSEVVLKQAAHLLLACACLIAIPVWSAERPAIADKLIFLDAKEAKGPVPRERIRACLSEFVREMALSEQALPTIFVIHVPKSAGMRAGATQTTLRRGASTEHPDTYYELWIVDRATLNDYVVAIERILEDHFALQLTAAARSQLLTRVAKYLDYTVNAVGE